ncbi:hypothetical protein M9H77_05983 [Catharanthus roseus]|uniref:Uncharacterized protein n=1 Tax=Catharanthus roseus TaxID=4058 RepID=A0ACC0BR09_CATRO|nr:hypothetical protein M9H77_05983 [Catharanthus roseus]
MNIWSLKNRRYMNNISRPISPPQGHDSVSQKMVKNIREGRLKFFYYNYLGLKYNLNWGSNLELEEEKESGSPSYKFWCFNSTTSWSLKVLVQFLSSSFLSASQLPN